VSEIEQRLRRAIEHFEHVLPGQAAIRDFVHHNTLHGFQHLPFAPALEAARQLTGASGFLPDTEFRTLYASGRIDREDLVAVLRDSQQLNSDDIVFTSREQTFRKQDIYVAALLHPLGPVTGCQLNWQIEELDALHAFQPDVGEDARRRLLASDGGPRTEAIEALWYACLHVLGLDHFILHPEDLLDLSPQHAERMLGELVPDVDQPKDQPMMDRLVNQHAARELKSLFEQVGTGLTLGGMLKQLTGEDILAQMRPVLIRHVAAFLDQGFAAWTDAQRERGFYAVWRASARLDLARIFEELPDWADSLAALPDDPFETVLIELRWLGLPEEKWEGYLRQLALELPGWSGMFLWRHQRPGYQGLDEVNVDMMDYLAVRLVMERLYAQKLCRDLWQIEASLDVIRWYLRHHLAEFLVRMTFYNQRLPEYLQTLAQRQLNCSDVCVRDEQQWLHLAHLIWTWQRSPASDKPQGYTVFSGGWPLFRLAQHLGLSAAEVRNLNIAQADMMFDCMEAIDACPAGYIWLQAYERHYREQLFNAVCANHGRGHRETRRQAVQAQLVFCMDDREEGIRRHLEEHNPAVETFGAAGFFGIPINWLGLDDCRSSPLCPVVVTPAHNVGETVRPGHEATLHRHDRRRALRQAVGELLFQESRRNLLSAGLLIALAAPLALLILVLKSLMPLRSGRWTERLRAAFELRVPTDIGINAAHPEQPATPERPRDGFTDEEQAERVQGFLRTIGLQRDFAPLLVMMGHGSRSQNNPHLAAYDCGACSGRHGGPNARAFAAMANRPEVRALLRRRGLNIPDSTWVLGAEHDTCDETITWFDSDRIPAPLRDAFTHLQNDLQVATRGSAHERARRFASAPVRPTPLRAARHVAARARDFSQVRPELGHATNAAALIGRRAMSRGAFFDRRVFLISYDPTQDPEGRVLEAILLAAGPVGAGINLEYYFSTVNNSRYGCGSKVTHNITGLLGVMMGTSGDLQTGLPRQMIEIHEAMRLQVLVEATPAVLTAVYARQPLLQELIGNGWLLLSAKHPDSGEISVFTPGRGFEPWQGERATLPRVAKSSDWYQGHSGPLLPALIDSPEVAHG
jgi:uncharacterized protein YbcC (UPF0753/DUF2309 family)